MGLTVVVIVVGTVLVFAGLISAAVTDVVSRIIPNWLVLMVGAGGVVLRLAMANWHGMWTSAVAAVALFVALRLLSGLSALGGGDVKLIAAVALGQPPVSMLPILLGVGVAGGVIAVFYLTRDRFGRRDERQDAWRHLEMPYAPAILAGVAWHELWDLAA